MSGPISLVPNLAKEASAARVSTSLLVIVAIAWGAFKLGSGQAEDATIRAKRDAEIATGLATIGTVVAELKQDMKDTSRDVAAVRGDTSSLRAEVELTKKDVQEIKERRR